MASSNTNGIAKELFNMTAVNPQRTYHYQFRDKFYALIPASFKPYYYEVIRRSINWASGYVPGVHRADTGMFSTAIGNFIVKELSKLIMGGRLFARNVGIENETDLNKPNKTLSRYAKWEKYYDFQTTIQKYIEFTIAGGTGALKLNINAANDLVARPLRIDQFFYEADFSGKVTNFLGFLKNYTAKIDKGNNRSKVDENFYLVEQRYYDENFTPKMKVLIKRDFGQVTTSQSFDASDYSSAELRDTKWEQLPITIQKMIKEDYGQDMLIGVEQDLPFDDLGIIIARYTVANRTPEIDMGEPALLNVLTYLWNHDYIMSSMATDEYLGRGKVLVPKTMHNPSIKSNAYYEGFDDPIFTKLPMDDVTNQKPISIQFDLRMMEWEKARNINSENIATQIGVSGSDMFPYLRDATGSSKTATQIASESQKTISFTEEKRRMFTNALDQFVMYWKKFYNESDDFTLRFSSQNMVNKLVTVEEVRVMKEIGMSKFDTFQAMFPGMDEHQVWEMVKRSNEEAEEKMRLKSEYDAKDSKNEEESGIKEKEVVEETDSAEVKYDSKTGQPKKD